VPELYDGLEEATGGIEDTMGIAGIEGMVGDIGTEGMTGIVRGRGLFSVDDVEGMYSGLEFESRSGEDDELVVGGEEREEIGWRGTVGGAGS